MLRNVITLAALLSSASALAAAPEYVPVTGFLTDDTGTAVDGQVMLHLKLYTSDTGSGQVWAEDQTVDVDNGQFTVYLGDSTTLPLSTFRDNPTLYLGLAVGTGAEMTPRFQVATAPFAAYAQYADSAAMVGTIAPADIRLNSTPVTWSELTGVPADLADGDATGASYAAGAGIAINGTTIAVDQATVEGWASGAVSGDYIPNVSCATADMVPVSDGLGGWTCDDVHSLIDASLIATGTLPLARIPTGTTATTVALGNHSHTMTSLLGTIGTSPAWPATSCKEIKAKNASATDGVYWLNSEGDNRSPFQAYCDMTTDGGGWTMCYTNDGTSMVRIASQFEAAPVYGTNGYRADCRNIPFMDVLYVNHASNEKAWFKRDTRTELTMSANYNAAGSVYGLWTGGGVADTAYKYQLNVCDTAWMYTGLMVSGRVGCDKACNAWCADTTTQYYRTDGDDTTPGSYNGVSFRENGHRNVTNKLMSVGVR